ncbi:ABC transporter permease [Cohnella sp. AR92]|uniref:ABC transporter permease n=1 Tax=Cohnella sp. AR92 TaxID=648716 RepID=UPI000F8D3608|nr:ABC transporter permease [Cohnella sp. AR92]RUS48619.1 ABC transporter permease [Cohnella sp. AR92]
MLRLELKKGWFSVTYILYVIFLVGFLYSQVGAQFDRIDPPKPGADSYGMRSSNEPSIIMQGARQSLEAEYAANSYAAYPLGFYKNVKLSEREQDRIGELLAEIAKAQKAQDFSRFKQRMDQADKLIGGGTSYASGSLSTFGNVPRTYEEALSDYNLIVEKDRFSGADARLFSDYLGVMLAFVPVFVAVAFGMKDRRAGMKELLDVRSAASIRIVGSRYLALIIALFLPVLLLAAYATYLSGTQYGWSEIDRFAFFKYSFGWLLPTLLATTAIGMFLTELTETPIAVAVQGIGWFVGLNQGIKHIDGGYGWDLALRHNTAGNSQQFLDHLGTLAANRIGYTLLSLLLVLATAWIYERKRRGKLNVRGFYKKIRLPGRSQSAQ